MSLTRRIKVNPDDTPEILAKENGRICSQMDLNIVIGVFVQPTCGTEYRNL